jgi:type II secretory pathway component GspD/PulD (secretin)
VKFLIIFLSLFMFTLTAHADSQQMVTKVIQLHYIEAQTLIPQLKPLLLPGEKMSGTGGNLILQVSPATLTQLRPVIHQLDSPPVVFIVSIHQGSDEWLSEQNETVYSVSSRTEAGNSQSVQVMSGQSAFISTGNNRPVISSVSGGIVPGVSYEQKQETQGFYVIPILQGEQVEIKLRRAREFANPANAQASANQYLETTTMVPLNKWVKLGDAAQSDINSQPSSTTYEAGNTFTNQAALYIKVSMSK